MQPCLYSIHHTWLFPSSEGRVGEVRLEHLLRARQVGFLLGERSIRQHDRRRCCLLSKEWSVAEVGHYLIVPLALIGVQLDELAMSAAVGFAGPLYVNRPCLKVYAFPGSKLLGCSDVAAGAPTAPATGCERSASAMSFNCCSSVRWKDRKSVV